MRRLLPSLGLFLATLAGCQCGNVRIGTVRPHIEADPASLDFGSTAVGFPVEKSVALLNQSHAVLHLEEVSLIGEAAQAFTTSLPEVVDVEAGASVSVRVVYSPGAEGNHSARLLVRSDAANAPELLVPLAGTALAADPCAQVVCDSPPGPCFQELGVCAGGSCTYLPKDEGTQCNDGNDCTEADSCRAGSCQGVPKACTTPPAGSCTGPNSFVSYASPGTCVSGTCQYAQTTHACAGGCTADVCQPDPCTGVTCNNPPPCFKGGMCVSGSCQYQVDVGASCNDGNACTEGDTCSPSGVCAGAPKSCNTPPPSICLDAQSQRSYDSVGSCGAGGTCSYTSRDVTCALGCDSATGQCRSTCPSGQHICNSQCVSDSSTNSCGSSCTPCPVPTNGTATCSNGACGFTCNSGYNVCGSACCGTATASRVSAGWYHSCALTAAGTIKCWGLNRSGQLGDGTTTNRAVPRDVSGLVSIAGIAAGGEHSCAVTNTSALKCWGNGASGRLGDGAMISRLTPVDVLGVASVAAATAGFGHTCAVSSNGGVKCWGSNFYGQVGDGSTIDRLSPVDVSGLVSGIAAVAGGERHTCVLTSAGGVKCWGTNSQGQVGDGTATTRLVPVDVLGLTSGVVAIAAGYAHTCAVTNSGGVKCWGYNNTGAVGDGTTTGRSVPTDVSGLTSGVVAIAAGYAHTCAVTNSGGVKCWGWNDDGQVGDGARGTYHLTPVDVVGLGSGVAAVAAGYAHTCVLTTTGGVKCWGLNDSGQLGDGTNTDRLVPVNVVSFP